MSISWSAWEQAQHNLVEDFLDLFLPPRYPYPVETDYPKTASMEALIKNRFHTLDLPELKLVRLGKLIEESWLEDFLRKEADWAVVFTYEVLGGFGQRLASNLQGAAFEGLKQLADTWGLYLAKDVERLFHKWQLFMAFTDFTFDIFVTLCQIPSKELGEAIRASITPAYLRAGETVAYEVALFDNNRARMKESLDILEASDAELEREIANMFSGYSTTQVGRQMQRMLIDVVSQFRQGFSSNEFKEKFNDTIPTAALIAGRNISWYLGYRLSQNLQYDPQRTKKLLEAIGHHGEITATMERYRYRLGWQGDKSKAVALAWQAVAPKYFHLSPRVGDIKNDEGQEKLIGVAEGLEDYADKNRAIEALTDGFLGRLGAYLKRAAERQEKDDARKQMTDGNRALTEAKHAGDLRHRDNEEDEKLSDEEVLSRAKEKYCPSGDPVAEALERQGTLREWWKELTEKEGAAVTLMESYDNQQKVAEVMGISQPAVSQLLNTAWGRYKKVLKIPS